MSLILAGEIYGSTGGGGSSTVSPAVTYEVGVTAGAPVNGLASWNIPGAAGKNVIVTRGGLTVDATVGTYTKVSGNLLLLGGSLYNTGETYSVIIYT